VTITLLDVEAVKVNETREDPVQLAVFSHRFMSIAEQMGRYVAVAVAVVAAVVVVGAPAASLPRPPYTTRHALTPLPFDFQGPPAYFDIRQHQGAARLFVRAV